MIFVSVFTGTFFIVFPFFLFSIFRKLLQEKPLFLLTFKLIHYIIYNVYLFVRGRHYVKHH